MRFHADGGTVSPRNDVGASPDGAARTGAELALADDLDLGALLDMVRADGVVRDSELDSLRAILVAHGGRAPGREALRRAVDARRALPLRAPDPRGLSRRMRNMLLRHMIAIARADGELHASERALIARATEKLLPRPAAG